MTDELWIVHRDPLVRAALGRLAGEECPKLLGSPSDETWDRAQAPRVVVLGAAGDLEAELAFAARQLGRAGEAHWIVLHEAEPPREELARLFAGLPARWLSYPLDAATLRRAIARSARGAGLESLASRRLRGALEARLRRYTADLVLPELSRADGRAPAWIRGEPGTGRLLLARLLHARGRLARAPLVHVPCDAAMGAAELGAWLVRGEQSPDLTFCLEDVDRLSPALQRWLRGVAEGGAADLRLAAGRIAWLLLVREGPSAGSVEPALREALAGPEIHLPPLRSRPAAVAAFADATARAYAQAAGEPAPRFSEGALAALAAYPWPGNLRELEAVVLRTLASGPDSPIPAEALRFEGPAPPPEAAVAPAAERPPPADLAAGAAQPPPEPEAQEPAEPASGTREPAEALRRLASALAHELRNPLVAIRTFAALLPERLDDPEFREQFREQVEADVGRLETTLAQLARFAEAGAPRLAPVDVTALLESLLATRREEIQARRLLVLQELDDRRPRALADEALLGLALEGILSSALARVPDRADLFMASRYHARGFRGGPGVRVLLRFYDPRGTRRPADDVEPQAASDVSLRATALELLLAEQIVQAQGGRLRVDASEAAETLVVLDLPAPAQEAEATDDAHPTR